MTLENKNSKNIHSQHSSINDGGAAFDILKAFQSPQGKSKDQTWNELLLKIQSFEEKEIPVIPFYNRFRSMLAIAASIIILFTVGISIYFFNNTTINCPQGQQMSIVLPDQSTVLLNSGTTISYHNYSWNSNRQVHLKGEAFFKVKKGQRFDVKTPEAMVSVLGTSFNVFSRCGEVKVNCFTGKVAVKNTLKTITTVLLTPGKETFFKNTEQPIEPVAFDVSKTARWKDGEFYFNHDCINNVIAECERQYNIDIEYNGNPNRFYTGYFTNRSLCEALDLICMPMNLKYKKHKSKIIIN